MVTLDIDFVRAQFPSFRDPESARWAHLENAGGSYCPDQVVDLITELFAHAKCQPGWDFGPSANATRAMARSRTAMAELLGVGEAELHFGPSTSQNTVVLAAAMRPMWSDGDEIIVTGQDHEANQGAWRRLAASGIVVREWAVDPVTGLLDPHDLDDLVTERTRLAAFTHASNVAATINPVRAVADRVHAVGGHVVVDGVSAAPHGLPDIASLDCDVYLFSAYKTYGPHVGVMYTRRSVLEQMTNQSHYFKADDPTAWLTPAGPDHAAIGALGGIADYLDVLDAHHFGDAPEPDRRLRSARLSALFGAREDELMAPLLELLTGTEGVSVVGATVADHTVRAPTVAFHTPRRSSASIYDALIAAGVSCGHGDFYAKRLVTSLGLDPDDGVVRLSAVHYNTDEDIARACTVLADVL